MLSPEEILQHPSEESLRTHQNKKRRPSGENRRLVHVLAPSRRIRYSPPVAESTSIKSSIPEAFPLFKGKRGSTLTLVGLLGLKGELITDSVPIRAWPDAPRPASGVSLQLSFLRAFVALLPLCKLLDVGTLPCSARCQEAVPRRRGGSPLSGGAVDVLGSNPEDGGQGPPGVPEDGQPEREQGSWGKSRCL